MTGHRTAQDHDSYEIRIRGHLDDRWAPALAASQLTRESDGTTVLRSPAMDQSALHGLLQRIRDLGLPLISVARIDPEPPTLRPDIQP